MNYGVYVEPVGDRPNQWGRRHAAEVGATAFLCSARVTAAHTFVRVALAEPAGITCIWCSASLSRRYWTRQAVEVGEGFDLDDGRRARKPAARSRDDLRQEYAARLARAEADARASGGGVQALAKKHHIGTAAVSRMLARVRAENQPTEECVA